jgi:hypothetical protein
MILSNNICIAIGANRTEPEYEKISRWLCSENKRDVLNGWLQLISNCIQKDITYEEIKDLPYQLIHRIASAYALKKDQSSFVYLCFDLSPRLKLYYEQIIKQLDTLVEKKLNSNLSIFKSRN